MAIGSSAAVNASNKVVVGNTTVTTIGGYAGWTTYPSDSRFKKNVKENVPGLAFITKLKPITYTMDIAAIDARLHPNGQSNLSKADNKKISTDEKLAKDAKSKIVYTGFIAQDVEKAAKNLNYDFSGVDAPKNENDFYGLRYAEFVVPLVKAVQELSGENNELKKKDELQQKQIDELKTIVQALQQNFNSCNPCAVNSSVQQSTKIVSVSGALLEQNIPNPFNYTTTINYSLPQTYSSAKIIITDKRGKSVKEANVSGSGKGSLNIDASSLSSGAYQYSLYIDGRLIDTKQMMLAK